MHLPLITRCWLCNVRLIDIAKGQFDSTAYATSPLADAKRVFPYDEYRLFPRISGSCQFHNTPSTADINSIRYSFCLKIILTRNVNSNYQSLLVFFLYFPFARDTECIYICFPKLIALERVKRYLPLNGRPFTSTSTSIQPRNMVCPIIPGHPPRPSAAGGAQATWVCGRQCNGREKRAWKQGGLKLCRGSRVSPKEISITSTPLLELHPHRTLSWKLSKGSSWFTTSGM